MTSIPSSRAEVNNYVRVVIPEMVTTLTKIIPPSVNLTNPIRVNCVWNRKINGSYARVYHPSERHLGRITLDLKQFEKNGYLAFIEYPQISHDENIGSVLNFQSDWKQVVGALCAHETAHIVVTHIKMYGTSGANLDKMFRSVLRAGSIHIYHNVGSEEAGDHGAAWQALYRILREYHVNYPT